MSLNTQIFLYSIDTSAFYCQEEQRIHERLVKLYKLKNKYKNKLDRDFGWKKTSINRRISKEKEKLSEILDTSLSSKIPRQLNPKSLVPKNVITLFESSLTRAMGLKPNELTEDLMVVNVFFFQVFEGLVKNGFEYNGEKYVFLSASAGQIRTKRAVFIKQSRYDEIANRLMCGLTADRINAYGGINPNKYNAYLSLNNSATDVWEDFDIDRAIVVEDFETDVSGVVDFITDSDYKITRILRDNTITHTDGCGMVLGEKTRMVRLPWVKGLLVAFPFDEFIRENAAIGKKVKDIYGKEYDILADNIKYIFTKSQFKMWKYYDDWEDYKQKFKKHQCEACYCNIEEDYIPKARINYQMLQTLSDITDSEIDKLTRQTVEELESVGKDFSTTMRLLGATEYNQDPSYIQQALMVYPELFKDQYSRDILKQTKKSLVKQAKAGRLRVNGKYLFLSPDLYAFCEWLFLDDKNPKGLLQDGEVYCSEYKNGDELACLRSPHLYREWAIRKNVRNEQLDKWFGCTKCIYTSCHDLISRMLQFDNDGDKSLVVRDRNLINIAKRNMVDIVPLYYEAKKAQGGMLNNEAMYDGMAKAYTGGNIGPISNNITKVWNCGHEIDREQLDVVKWLCMENNYIIDYAKTLYQPTRPKEIDKIIKSYTKAPFPNFFMYAKNKERNQVANTNNSTMNRISAVIPSPKIRYCKTIGKFDYRVLMDLKYGVDLRAKNPILKVYDYYNVRQNYLINTDEQEHINQEDVYIYRHIREKIIEEAKADVGLIVNTLVAHLYTIRTNSTKKLLWSCFGEEILRNIKNNTVELGEICPVCGRRFFKMSNAQIVCSEECARKRNLIKQHDRDEKS